MEHAVNFEARLLAHLQESDQVSIADLKRAQAAATATGKRLDEALVELGFLTESGLNRMLNINFDVPIFQQEDLPKEPWLVDHLRPTYLARNKVFPVSVEGGFLTLAMVNPFDDFTAKVIALKVELSVKRVSIEQTTFDQIFETLYGQVPGFSPTVHEFSDADNLDNSDIEVLMDSASDAPVIRFVQEMIRQATLAGASDIHLKPNRNGADLYFRIDGMLVQQESPARQMVSGIASRLKILANLDIAERRLPQDGRVRATVAGQAVDLRLSTMPQIHGEGIVLRILSREVQKTTLKELGFSIQVQTGLNELFSQTEGLVLVTGPTGSGKSTTLYAALRRLTRPGLNIVTIEDPVEYRIDGISQIQVDEKVGLTFPRILRSLLRQDPDIILVGEIRDGETARIAVQAALTGHLVLATLHTNSACAAIPRLVDMGVEPYLLPAVLRGVLAQRLLRSACSHCSFINESGLRHAGTGCEHCSDTGYEGRIAVGELLILDAGLTESLITSRDPEAIMPQLAERGFVPLREDVRERVKSGQIERQESTRILNAAE